MKCAVVTGSPITIARSGTSFHILIKELASGLQEINKISQFTKETSEYTLPGVQVSKSVAEKKVPETQPPYILHHTNSSQQSPSCEYSARCLWTRYKMLNYFPRDGRIIRSTESMSAGCEIPDDAVSMTTTSSKHRPHTCFREFLRWRLAVQGPSIPDES